MPLRPLRGPPPLLLRAPPGPIAGAAERPKIRHTAERCDEGEKKTGTARSRRLHRPRTWVTTGLSAGRIRFSSLLCDGTMLRRPGHWFLPRLVGGLSRGPHV